MQSPQDLEETLERIDGNGYGAYNEIRGAYDFGDFALSVDHVQGDPFASPSKLSVTVPLDRAGFPDDLHDSRTRRVALEDYLTRAFNDACRRIAEGHRGSGKSGLITTLTPGQAVLPRTTCTIGDGEITVRFVAGLPASGRTPLSAIQGAEMLLEELPAIVEDALFYESHEGEAVYEHVDTVEDAAYIRERLSEEGLVAFVADDALLPRASGKRDEPMEQGAVPFESPDPLRVTFDCPHRGEVTGMGIPEGITLIVGGGYHGKSTLLNALAHGVYDHVPGDGREFVVTREDARSIRAEDGRFVSDVDISSFIGEVPADIDTSTFSSLDASGSTSQAANIVEALEAGSRLLLIDEDTSATNLMIRDGRMQDLVADEEEPISPLIDNIKALYDEHGVSSILVMGGSGAYFDVADTVIKMHEFLPEDVTDAAKDIYAEHGEERDLEAGEDVAAIRHRTPDPDTIDPRKGGKIKIRSRGDTIQFGTHDIDLSRVGQLSEDAQVRSIGDAVFHLAEEHLDGDTTLDEALDAFDALVERGDLMDIAPYPSGEYAAPRRYEVAAALNRLESLSCDIVDADA